MASKPKPTIRERAAENICPNCGKAPDQSHKHGPRKTYCDKECKTEYENRLTARGKVIATWALAWRVDRGSGEIAQGSFQQLCNILDIFNADDLAKDRPRACLGAAKILVKQSIYLDRRTN